jgi:hypothetical protein
MPDRSNGRAARGALVVGLLLVVSACSYAPMKDVRTEPAFIDAAIAPGDQISVETADGKELQFEVRLLSGEVIFGVNGEEIAYEDIDRLQKRSWEEVPHPCGGGRPVGCSIPEVITAVSGYYKDYQERFHQACVQHDFCYRHGYATYGRIRQECDDNFYSEMNKECGDTTLLRILDTDSFRRRAECKLAADQLYIGVQKYGSDAFDEAGSTVCEYEE